MNHKCSRQGNSWRRLGAPSLALLLIVSFGGTFVGCDDFGDGPNDGRGRFGRGGGRWDRDRDGREGWRGWHRGRRPIEPDAATPPDAGVLDTDAGDAGLATNADGDAAAQPVGEDLLDAGASSADAAAASGAAALSDGQILLVADTLLAGGIAQAQAALPALADTDAVSFAEQLIDEHAAARNTLSAVGESIGATQTQSDIADEVNASSDTLAAALAAPDAGPVDALYIESTVSAHGEALSLVTELLAGADAPALRAQLVVVQAVLELQLARAEQIAAAL